ncbi:thiamine pyrophosphokinase-related protein-like protein [Nemania sp. FL0031]|nr:thiamine pyrophosphokinase-related protein-like protein [Nemania sp. FL0031]
MAVPNRFTSLLEVLEHCDDFPLPQTDLKAYAARVNSLYHFKVSPYATTLGYVLPQVAREFGACQGWDLDETRIPRTLTLCTSPEAASRSAVIASTLARFKQNGTFRILEHWRSELKPCYGPTGEVLFAIERAAFPLLGIVAYGVMFIAYTRDRQGHVTGLWVQRRSEKARTHAGLYDGTAAGGMGVDETSFATLLAEAKEEASLSGEFIRRGARACGTISYFHTRRVEMGGEVGLLQPGVHFLYEMEVPDHTMPESNDENVAGFELLTLGDIRGEIFAGRAKPWFALAVIDFFIRHGIISEENERDFVEISMRLHRTLEFPVFGVSFLKTL